MRSPVMRYVLRTYLMVYTLLLVAFAGISYQAIAQTGLGDLFLLPLSVISTISAAVVFLDLAFRNEIETLQCYGVSFRDAAVAFALPLLATQMIAFALIGTAHTAHGLMLLALCLTSSLLALTMILKGVWRFRDRMAVRSCAVGVLAQLLLISIGVFCLQALS